MPLADGDPAEPADTWLRVITNDDYIKKDGTLAKNAFGGKAIAPPDPPRPWSLALSGGLLSLIADLQKYGTDFCGDAFVGYMFHKVEDLRNADHATDVIFTPIIPRDPAHADHVAYHLTVESKYLLQEWLQNIMLYVRQDRLDALEALRQAP